MELRPTDIAILPELETWLNGFGFQASLREHPEPSANLRVIRRDPLIVWIDPATEPPGITITRRRKEDHSESDPVYRGDDSAAAIAALREVVHGEKVLEKTVPVIDEREGASRRQDIEVKVSALEELRSTLEEFGAHRIRIDTQFQAAYSPGSGESGVRKGEETFDLSKLRQAQFLALGIPVDRGGREIWSTDFLVIVD